MPRPIRLKSFAMNCVAHHSPATSHLGRRRWASAWGRGGAGTALVGSHAEVAERIEEYAEVGISEFVLSAAGASR